LVFDADGANLPAMRTTIMALLFFGADAVPALAQVYPVQGRWGESASSEKGAIVARASG
jgi:hypothetical protein